MRVKRRDAEYRAVERERATIFRTTNPEAIRAQGARHRARTGLADRVAEMPDFDMGKPVTYETAHDRVVRWRGRAKIHACECGSPATNWAYRHGSPHERWGVTHARNGPLAVPFSPDPMDYDPMCRSCHTLYDRAKSRERASA